MVEEQNSIEEKLKSQKRRKLEQENCKTKRFASGDGSDPAKNDVDEEDCLSPLTSSTDTLSSSLLSNWLQMFNSMPKHMQTEALSQLVGQCSPTHVRHLQSKIVPHFQKDFIHLLPREISLKIISYLHPNDLLRAAQLSRAWRKLTEDSLLWAEKCREHCINELYPPNLGRKLYWQACGDESDGNSTFTRSNLLAVKTPPADDPFSYMSLYGEIFQSNSSSKDIEASTSQTQLSPEEAELSNNQFASSEALGRCYDRCKWKATYLRSRKIYNNWRKRRVTAECELRGHDEHVITCVQTCGDLVVTGSDDQTLRVWSASTAECKHVLTGHWGGVWTVQLSDDGQTVISGSTDRMVRVWDTTTGECIHTLSGHTSTVRCMALKNDILVSGSRDCTLRIWNIRKGLCLRTLFGHLAAVRCVQFDGNLIISGGYDCIIIVWDAQTGKQLHVLEGHTDRVYSLLFESKRNLIVSGSLDTTIRVWNIETGECLQTLMGHQSLTCGMQLYGDTLVSGNADSTIKVWNIVDGHCTHTLAGPNRHLSAVTSLQILENGLAATSGDDGTVKLWDINQGTFICDLVKLRSVGLGGCVWRLRATNTTLVCAIGSRNSTEDTKLILIDFDAPYP